MRGFNYFIIMILFLSKMATADSYVNYLVNRNLCHESGAKKMLSMGTQTLIIITEQLYAATAISSAITGTTMSAGVLAAPSVLVGATGMIAWFDSIGRIIPQSATSSNCHAGLTGIDDLLVYAANRFNGKGKETSHFAKLGHEIIKNDLSEWESSVMFAEYVPQHFDELKSEAKVFVKDVFKKNKQRDLILSSLEATRI